MYSESSDREAPHKCISCSTVTECTVSGSLEEMSHKLTLETVPQLLDALVLKNVGDVLPSQAAQSGFAEALINVLTIEGVAAGAVVRQLDGPACDLFRQALYRGRVVPDAPAADSADAEWAYWGQCRVQRGEVELAQYEELLKQIVLESKNSAEHLAAIDACKANAAGAVLAQSRLQCVVKLLHGTISTGQNLPGLSSGAGPAHGLEMLKHTLRCFLEGEGDNKIEVIAV